jgi:methionine biosynthesis protein MetW
LTHSPIRPDFQEILRLVRPRARVLDVGCGEGELLELLTHSNGVDGRGVEISPEGVSACLARGLSVMQGDAERDLDYFPAGAFDYVILSQTLQAVLRPRHVLGEMLRIGEQAIVSLPNFGHWRVRLDLLTHGRMPVTSALPEPWWATPNIHLCTVADFVGLCDELALEIDACAAFAGGRPARAVDPRRPLENLRAETALFLLSRRTR